MPHGELACGFLCGTRELYHWPKFDLYGLLLDTKPVWGNLLDWIPALTAGSLREALQIGVSNLYHAACHTYLYHENPKNFNRVPNASFSFSANASLQRSICSIIYFLLP